MVSLSSKLKVFSCAGRRPVRVNRIENPGGGLLLGVLRDRPAHEAPWATGKLSEQVLAVLREALSNAARHSGATRVDVTVDTGADGLLTVLVKDNGRGIRPGSRRSGLANMADRAVGLGGRLRIAPADGGGTELEWQVPVPAQAPAGQEDGPAPPPGRYPLR